MSEKIFLPGLNGIRAIAALAVVMSHINLGLDKFGFDKSHGLSLASFGVTVFFALSGFLITYLLLVEKEKTKTIAIKKFYVRRVLRIWPLYFFYMLLVLFAVGSQLLGQSLWFYLFMMPNVPFAVNASGGALVTLPFLAHYWSLGVEEQFYAFWPHLVKKIKSIGVFLVSFAVLFFGLKLVLKFLNAPNEIQSLLHYTRFGCLAIGGIGAYVFHYHKNKVSFFQYKIVEILAWGVFVLIAFDKFHLFSIVDHEIVAVVTLVIIFNQVNNTKKLVSLENPVFDYLGKISFGLYVYNPLVIYCVSLLFNKIVIENAALKLILIYTLVPLSIIAVAHLSYFYFEKRFLTLKTKYTTIHSAASKAELND